MNTLQKKYSGSSMLDIEKNHVITTENPVPEKKKFRWRIEDTDSPSEIYNWTLYLSVFVFGVLGAARGLDEGSISGSVAQPSFKNQFGLSDKLKSADQLADLKSNITSMVQLGSVAGAMVAMYTVDKLGRVNALREVCVIWVVGVIIQITSYDVGQLYAGRFIEGLAIGQTTTIGPTYLAEVAPKQIRGLCGCIFAGAVYLGIMLAYFAHYGTALHMEASQRMQWVVPTSLKIIFAGSILIMSFVFTWESPRWYLKAGKPEKAIHSLSKLRNLPPDHPYIVGEISDINEQLSVELAAVSGNSAIGVIKEFIMKKANRYRFFLVVAAAQVLGQWSGANAVTIYAPELFAVIGVTGVEKMKMTAILGLVKFCSAYLCAFFIIDFLGRKKALYMGITLQMVCLLYFAIFLTIVPGASDEEYVMTGSQARASKGALAALFLSGCGWTMGFNSIQYLLGSEIFPLNVRSFAQSAVMVLHFANQYGNSKALPKMMISLHPYGAFYFFVGVLVIALFWAWFFVPEVAGRSLESMEDIFNLPWYLVGRKGPELCPDHSELNRIHFDHGIMSYEQKNESQEFVEDVEKEQDEQILKNAEK